ncbi:MAG: aminotransferase class I/II-fold pyridoxal phosphate-dependent enzyme [Spirochaetales bacterium]|jgi:DNA-binding transcriptional MocR family regulator|nr:aminotransferase class I/II-fold pyridoxal phosphate-dependent enzyme [Spirochaetales bacterium]
MESREELKDKFERCRSLGLKLNIQRGQPSPENLALSDPMLTILKPGETTTAQGIDLRNYPGGPAGLGEAREILSPLLGVRPEELMVGNNSSLKLLADLLKWALLAGLGDTPVPWVRGKPKILVPVPGYDRHFTLLDSLGFEMIPVPLEGDGPDLDRVEKIAASDPEVKGLLFVPTYSNPTGETTSDEKIRRLAAMRCAAPDFTLFADEAYRIHHLYKPGRPVRSALNLLSSCREAGNPHRAYLFGSTSKITFAGAGIGCLASGTENLARLSRLFGAEFIGPNKIEQYRHVLFLRSYPGGMEGLMKDHGAILRPKFEAAEGVLERELGGTGLARWTNPEGGYFINLTAAGPFARRTVALAEELGVSLTPAGAAFPHGRDPEDAHIRIAPTRPPVEEVVQAMEILCLCLKLASLEGGS